MGRFGDRPNIPPQRTTHLEGVKKRDFHYGDTEKELFCFQWPKSRHFRQSQIE